MLREDHIRCFSLIVLHWYLIVSLVAQYPRSVFKGTYLHQLNKNIAVSTVDAAVFDRAFPGFLGIPISASSDGIDRVNRTITNWPAVHSIGDTVHIGEKAITVVDHRFVKGSNEPLVFTPSTGALQTARGSIYYGTSDWDRIFIPPQSTLVMIAIEVIPESSSGCTDFRSYRFSLHIPSYPAVEAWYFIKNTNLGDYPSAGTGCLTSGWLYFSAPGLLPDSTQTWFTVEKFWPGQPAFAIWSLILDKQ